MIKNYFKTAWRNLVKSKFHSFVNITGLSVGMAVAILIGLWIWDELSFNKNFPNYDRITQVMQNQTFNGEVQTWGNVALPLGPVLRKSYGNDFKYIVRSGWAYEHKLTYGEKKLKQSGNYMEPEVINMLSLKMLHGSSGALNDMNSVILSQSAATSIFGKDDPMNKIIQLDDKTDVRVTGVYGDIAANSSFRDLAFIAPWELMVKIQHLDQVLKSPWGASWFQTYAQVADNASIAAVSNKIKYAKLNNVSQEAARNKPEIFLHPMSKWYLYAEFKNGVIAGGRIQYLWLFGIIGVFVLLLACINFMNLSTARSEKRAKEVGIRKAIGSLRKQLIFHFFSESLLMAMLAFGLSLILVTLMLPFFNTVAGKETRILWSSPLFWIACLAFTFFTGIIAGSYPAFYLSSFRPVQVLKGSFRAGRLAGLPRKVLVVVQFSVSVILIIGTITVFRQIQFAKNRATGYSRNNFITVNNNGHIHDHFQSFRDDMVKSGAVAEVAESETSITNTYLTNSGFNWRGKDPAMQEEFVSMGVTHEFGKTAGWQIIEGRDFSREFPTDSAAIILNETAVKYIGLQHPVGETIQWGKNEKMHVIGVVKDMVTQNPYDPIKQTFFYLRSGFLSTINIKIKPAIATAAALDNIKSIVKKYNPDEAFEYKFIDEEYAKKFDNEERIGKLGSFFAVLALFISCLGLFGMASFMAEQRVKEIGVRKVLGATVFALWRLLSKDFVGLVIISLVIAIPTAWYCMHNWLQGYQYRATLSWWIFASAGASAIFITLLTVSFQAIKAAMANPVKSLRSE